METIIYLIYRISSYEIGARYRKVEETVVGWRSTQVEAQHYAEELTDKYIDSINSETLVYEVRYLAQSEEKV